MVEAYLGLKQNAKALELAEKVLEVRKEKFGGFDNFLIPARAHYVLG